MFKIIPTIFLLIFILFNSFGQNSIKSLEKQDEYRNTGFFNITKLGYISTGNLRQERFIEGEGNVFSDLDNSGAHAWSIQTINGFFISPYYSLGIGVGLDGHHDPRFNTMPIFLDARAYLSDDGDSAYSFLSIGPTIKLGAANSDLRKGLLFNLGIGYKFNIGNQLFLISDIFYSHKTVSLTNEGIGTSDNIIKSNGIGLNLGVVF